MPVLAGDCGRFLRKPGELQFQSAERDAARDLLPRFCGARRAAQLLQCVDRCDVDGIHHMLNGLRAAAIARSVIRNPLSSGRRLWGRAWTRVEQFAAPCGPVVAVVGPDDVGKAEVLERVRDQLPQVFTGGWVRHWPSHGERTHRSPHWLRLASYGTELTLAYWLRDAIASSRQQMVLYDRCALDLSVDPARFGLSSPRGARLLWQLAPRPDLVVLLSDAPEHIAGRGSALAPGEIERQLGEWMRLAKTGAVGAVVHMEGGPEAAARRLTRLIVSAFIAKNDRAPDGLPARRRVPAGT